MADDKSKEDRVQCLECGDWHFRLDVHLKNHKMNVATYLEKHPGAETISESSRKRASKAQEARSLAAAAAVTSTGKLPKARPTRKEGAGLVAAPEATEEIKFMTFGKAKLPYRNDLSEYDQQYVPVHDERWIPGTAEYAMLEELAMAIEVNANCLIVGPPGIGKTTLALELAAICNHPVIYANMDGETRKADFIGEVRVIVDPSGGHTITSWLNGPLVEAIERGYWILINEVDATPPQIAFVLHSVMETVRRLTLMGDGGRCVKFHPNFRVIGTANTLGHGDESGAYAGTNVMNHAFLDRWGVTIAANYPTEETEIKILMSRTPNLVLSMAQRMVRCANKVREAVKNEQCNSSISPRRLIDWAEFSVRLGDARRAAQLTITNKMSSEDAKFVDNIIQLHVGGKV